VDAHAMKSGAQATIWSLSERDRERPRLHTTLWKDITYTTY